MKKKLPKVHILLASYNGENRIRRQIDSILQQSYPNLAIYVRDDGSTDGTTGIIKEYESKTGRVHLLRDEKGNLKPPATFYQMLRSCPGADYYGFSDQDDIWHPQKVARAVHFLEKAKSKTQRVLIVGENQGGGKLEGQLEKGKPDKRKAAAKADSDLSDVDRNPRLYMSSYNYLTEKGDFIRQFPDQRKSLHFCQTLFNSPASAFTLLFNEAARASFLPDTEDVQEMHDRRFVRSALAMGQLIYDPAVTAHHIRYDNSLTEGDSTTFHLILTSLKNEVLGSDFRKEREELKKYLKQYENKIREADRAALAVFSSDNTPRRWAEKLFYPHRLRTRIPGEISMRLAILLGRV